MARGRLRMAGFPSEVVYGWRGTPIRLLAYPFVERRQVPMILSAQKAVEVTKLHFIDMPVVVQRQVPFVVTVQKPVVIRTGAGFG